MHHHLDEWEGHVDTLAVATTRACSNCIIDPELWRRVQPVAATGTCDFCGASATIVTFEDLEEVITNTLHQFYVTVDESGAYHDEGEWSEHVDDVQDILDDWLREAVDNCVFAPLTRFAAAANAVEYGFVRKADLWASLYEHDEAAWHSFLAESRLGDVSKAASDLLAALDSRSTQLLDRVAQVGRQEGMFKQAQPTLWRCRAGGEERGHRTAGALGTAPVGMAPAGRLNARGHSCFYGSTTERGAILESAKHSGASPEFWIGRFEPSRTIYHLDVYDVPDPPSPFAQGAADSHDALIFLRKFSATISQPNDPGDAQHYLPTQIFTAFLLADPEPPEGIKFASSIDSSSENWIVFVGQEHCTDEHPENASDLALVLDQDSPRHVPTSQVVAIVEAPPQ